MTDPHAKASPLGSLAGVRVVDCTDELGAYGTRVLASLGADVVRVVDPLRTAGMPHGEYDVCFNAEKAVVAIDPTNEEQRSLLAQLVERADVIVESMAGSLLADVGITAEHIAQANPHAIDTRISPLGVDGPDAWHRASDLTLMARGGLMSLAGYPDRAPVGAAGHQTAIATGLYGAIGSLLALLSAEATGRGQRVDVPASRGCRDHARELGAVLGSRTDDPQTGWFEAARGGLGSVPLQGRLHLPDGGSVDDATRLDLDRRVAERSRHRGRPRAHGAAVEGIQLPYDAGSHGDLPRGLRPLCRGPQEGGPLRGRPAPRHRSCARSTRRSICSRIGNEHRRFFVPMDVGGRSVQMPRGPFVMSATPLRAPRAARQVDPPRGPAGPRARRYRRAKRRLTTRCRSPGSAWPTSPGSAPALSRRSCSPITAPR